MPTRAVIWIDTVDHPTAGPIIAAARSISKAATACARCNALPDTYEDLVKAGVTYPATVVRSGRGEVA
jgi:hypothetical protein